MSPPGRSWRPGGYSFFVFSRSGSFDESGLAEVALRPGVKGRRKPVSRHFFGLENGKGGMQALELVDVVEDRLHDLVHHVFGHLGRSDEGRADAEGRRVVGIATIPGGMYRGNSDDTTTFGVGATFVTSAEVSEDVVYEVVKAVFDNIDQFKSLHPAFAILEPEEMATDGLSAPLHAGAERYFREAGLIE